jgi:hypothetical protein
MAIAFLFDNPNGSQEQYDAVRGKLDISDDNPPEGAILHVAGASPSGGWRVFEVWESRDAQKKFTEERLAPLFKEFGVNRPDPQTWDVHNIIKR